MLCLPSTQRDVQPSLVSCALSYPSAFSPARGPSTSGGIFLGIPHSLALHLVRSWSYHLDIILTTAHVKQNGSWKEYTLGPGHACHPRSGSTLSLAKTDPISTSSWSQGSTSHCIEQRNQRCTVPWLQRLGSPRQDTQHVEGREKTNV